MGAFWHGFANMSAVQQNGELVMHRGEGAQIWDAQGRRYLDATAGLWFANVGHGRQEIADAVAAQLGRLAHYSTFGDFSVDTTGELAERLATIAPVADSKIFFTSGGSDSIDTAAKLARRYWVERGRPTKTIIIGRTKAYHGMHVAGTALAGIPGNHEGYGELMQDALTVGWDSGKDLLEAIERLGADRIAAFFCEPVIGAGGVYPPPAGYLDEVRRICRDHDILFVADEVITGFGRIGGSWFASGKFDLQPDIMTTAKGLTSGYVPMGAVFVAPTVWEPFFTPGGQTWWRHGYTYGGHAGAAAAAMATLDIIEREDLLTVADTLAARMHELLAPLADIPGVHEVRSGTGALAAVQLADPPTAMATAAALRGRGIATRAVGAGGVQVSPPFVITDGELTEIVDALTAVLTAG
ncbi:aspartate aminotransferase family protein [Nakamurella flavida]|uniref:Aspartate aminotransferase family protein n=2 Tax=Nakamurella flavida TaxID=363630 RepID=A0A938YNH2_9ACTN|nr:aminotransferase class III-fold pyridoxal phosphate-dependent enzyme [Nakamurella flavida]MBM9477791.1 aspartate aminotransferase family protein [Nakamurella flavida]MDP9779344.1 adenosylmethionine-8-amino-7-oxononanoate aminotransferase [Nakamurella flavida]